MKKSGEVKIYSFLKFLREKYPENLAESWDPVGHLIGDEGTDLKKIWITVEATPEKIREACRNQVSLLLVHHPLFFPKDRGLTKITAPHFAFEAVRAGLNIYCAHTNFDVGGVDAMKRLAQDLGVSVQGRLVDPSENHFEKIVFFAPVKNLEKIADALFQAGAGKIGNYDSCGFSVEGEGSFRALEGAQPTIGKKGRLEKVREKKFETIYPRRLRPQVVKALIENHPYEEVAYDIYAIANQPSHCGMHATNGYGFYGAFKKPVGAKELARRIREVFGENSFWQTGELRGPVKSMGFTPGKGSSFLKEARRLKLDVFVTGEVGYHSAKDHASAGGVVIELGHVQSERYFGLAMQQDCEEFFRAQKLRTRPEVEVFFESVQKKVSEG